MPDLKLNDRVRVKATIDRAGFYATVVRVGRRWVYVCGVKDGDTCGRAFVAMKAKRIVTRTEQTEVIDGHGSGLWLPCDRCLRQGCGRFERSELEWRPTKGGGEVVPFSNRGASRR